MSDELWPETMPGGGLIFQSAQDAIREEQEADLAAEVLLAGDPLALLDSKLLADYVAWKQAADDADELLASIRLLPVR